MSRQRVRKMANRKARATGFAPRRGARNASFAVWEKMEVVRVALTVALAVALSLWLATLYLPERVAEQCPWPHCELDITGTDSASPYHELSPP